MLKSQITFVFMAVCIAKTATCPSIRTRHNWGGRTSKSVEYQNVPVPYVIIHHTATSSCSSFEECAQNVANIQAYHMDNLGWEDIGYNFLIGNDGNIYEGVGWNKVGAHVRGYNKKSIGVAFIGNFNDELPNESALNVTKCLLNCGMESGRLSRNYRLMGARQVRSTGSPGLMLYNEIQNWDNWVVSP